MKFVTKNKKARILGIYSAFYDGFKSGHQHLGKDTSLGLW